MEQAPLRHLLDGDSGPELGGRALSSVVRRRRRRRAARFSATALTAVIALGGTALGLGISQSSTGRLKSALPGPELPSKLQGANNSAAGALVPAPFKAPSGLKFESGATFAPAGAAISGSSAAVTSTSIVSNAVDNALCLLSDCTYYGGFGPVAHQTVEDVSVEAYLVSVAPTSLHGDALSATGNREPAALPNLPAALPSCERLTELLVRVTVNGKILGQFAAPETVGVTEPFEALSEAVLRPTGSEAVLVATALLSSRVASVSADFPNSASSSATPSHGWVVFVGLAPSSSPASSEGVTLEARSTGGSVLERAHIPEPGLIGVALPACPAAKP